VSEGPGRPKRLILDLDTTADPTHGQQEFSAFPAFYDEHIYLPLRVYDQDGDLVAAVLQPGKPQGRGRGRRGLAAHRRARAYAVAGGGAHPHPW
jgi:hypothetical protein